MFVFTLRIYTISKWYQGWRKRSVYVWMLPCLWETLKDRVYIICCTGCEVVTIDHSKVHQTTDLSSWGSVCPVTDWREQSIPVHQRHPSPPEPLNPRRKTDFLRPSITFPSRLYVRKACPTELLWPVRGVKVIDSSRLSHWIDVLWIDLVLLYSLKEMNASNSQTVCISLDRY